ncbi:hypothetical protein THRCLA_04479 [Thraustotheca clavata]|uniref:Uncharacterized protein n=1 Tax=Thraustotheca clavata TaxID=74557 RepID=A0A1V9ZYY1_9STRA|nr:hypothetical protein THRCLA_04479 [Thraustotheca clavata]
MAKVIPFTLIEAPVEWTSWLKEFCGIFYMVLSLLLSSYYLVLLNPYLSNDYLWYNFFNTNVSSALTSALNLQLTFLSNTTTIELINYRVSKYDKVGVSPAYPRKLVYNDLTTLEASITSLRNLAVVQVVYMITQYCWVDLERRWAMAHTIQRQERCREHYQQNGAVYLETVLRNIDFNHWVESTQGLFDARIGMGIQEFFGGVEFLTYLEHHEFASIEEEKNLWMTHGITFFKLDYSNQREIGIVESIQIKNSLGATWTFPIKEIKSTGRGTLWTTGYMYGSLQNDFNIPQGNMSLIQNASTFFGLIDPMLMEEADVCFPLTPSFQAVHDHIGSLDSIDLYLAPIPTQLVEIVNIFRSTALSAMHFNSKDDISTVGTFDLHPTPPRWANSSMLFYGASPMCGFGSGLPFIQESFSFDDACATQKPLAINWNFFSSLFAFTMLQGQATNVCSLVPNSEVSLCQRAIAELSFIYIRMPALSLLRPPNLVVNASVMQYVSMGVNGTIEIETQSLLDKSFAFYGWISMYDWALHHREVVSVEGDVGSIILMSRELTLQPQPSHYIDSSVSIYLWYSCSIVSIGLVGVGLIVSVLWGIFQPLRCSWFVFNRVVSASWLNRSILLIRGIVAVFCLASASVLTIQDKNGLYFVDNPRSIVTSCIFAGEATWLSYVVHEAFYPFTREYTLHYARWSSAVSLLTLLALDVWSPIQAQFTLHPSCFTNNVAEMVYCTSGTVIIGNWKRSLLLIFILFFCTIVCFLVVSFSMSPSYRSSPSLLLPAAAVAFIELPLSTNDADQLNVVTAAMTGVLQLSFKKFKILFDVKLWRTFTLEDISIDGAILTLPHTKFKPSLICNKGPMVEIEGGSSKFNTLKKQAKKMLLLSGFVYTIVTLCTNIIYLTFAGGFLANDFGWAGFNTTGMHTFLGNILNNHLLLSTDKVLSPSSVVFADTNTLYNGTVSSIVSSFNAPRRQLFNPSVPLTSTIKGLRDMNPCMLPWMATQYCFLDFNRTWSMASTTKRQLRCQSQQHNAALYLEAPLRNMNDWAKWQSCWGTSFEIGFASYLRTTTQGQFWLTTVQSNTNSIQEEVLSWLNHNFTTFELQWQNYKTIGMTDSFTITSALGYTSSLTLSHLQPNFHIFEQTSLRMYWSFASDLWAVSTNSTMIGGASLIASSGLFAFGNVSSESLLYENLTLIQPLRAGLAVLKSVVGPFGVVDMVYISPPEELLFLYGKFLEIIYDLLLTNSDAQSEYVSIPPKSSVSEVPPFLLSDSTIMNNGGDLLCGNDVPYEPAAWGLLSGLSSTTVCYTEFTEVMMMSTMEVLFAFTALNSTQGSLVYSDLLGICKLDISAGASCAPAFNKSIAFLQNHASKFSLLGAKALAATRVVQALQIEVIQYYTTLNNTATTKLYRINVLEPTERLWNFYGYGLIYEWVYGKREVVKFQGDVGFITTITYNNPLINTPPDPTEIPVSFASIFSGCTLYITWILVSIAGIVALYSVVLRGHLEGLNLFEINRLVGNVWAGRTFLIVRSITAMWILNTAPLNLTLLGHVTYISSPPLPWYKTILAGSEVTWLVYALNDLFSVYTKQYTTYYAFKSSISTWFSVSVWTFIAPLQYSAKLSRDCSYVDMDFGLICKSGLIEIGSLRGVLGEVVVAVVCVVCFYFIELLIFPKRVPLQVQCFLLSAQGLYMLELAKWEYETQYYLDRTSAVMVGLLTIEYRGSMYIFDIKSWRILALPIVHHRRERRSFQPYYRSIPLSRI